AALATNDHLVQGDAMTFHQVAQHLADGQGFRRPFVAGPTAEHPPGWELLLAAADRVGANGYLAHRLIGALLGTVTVVLVGLLGPLLAVPRLWRAPRSLAVCLVAFAVVLAPWTIRNLTTFDRPVLISNNANGLWVGANCGPSYHGPLIGYWVFQCYTPERRGE